MKTLQLSTIVLLLAGVFYSCTREDFPPTREAGATNATGGNKAIATVSPFNVDPENPVPLASTIEVSGTLNFDKAVNQFNYRVQVSTFDATTNTWSEFEDTKYGEAVSLGATGNPPNRQLITRTTFPFEFEFPASEVGVGKTRWRLHVTGNDAHNAFLGDETLEIVESCVETFTIGHDVDARNIGDGNYEFTITYTLKSPDDVENIHFQGGATSGGQFQHVLVEGSLTGGLQVRHHNNQNTVLYYDGPLTKCEPLELSFKYIRKFSCPAEAATVTGQWTATAVGMEPYIVAPLTYSCNPDGTKK